jgi:predicted enzyme related to lactoylglutathione lyase
MSDRYIPGVPCWIDTSQPDAAAAAEFYGQLFGWELEDVMPPEAPGRYYMARLPGGDVGAVGSAPEGSDRAVWNTYVWVENADETAAKVRDAGGTVLEEPFDVFDAGRMAICADPEGAPFSVWQAGRNRGATVVNEPGSLNFNVLNTRDLDSAAKFYGAVFGWELIDVGGAPMWALPGYDEFLESRTPGTLKGAAEMGAPTRFMEVVAAAAPLGDDQPDTPPHWSITFGVADADEIAAKATELGGTVLMPPFDAPWVRMTVIRDPQGATFTASKFVPENRDLPRNAGAAAGA